MKLPVSIHHACVDYIVHFVVCVYACIADEHDVNQWTELLKFLFQCCNMEQPRLYESALHIIG